MGDLTDSFDSFAALSLSLTAVVLDGLRLTNLPIIVLWSQLFSGISQPGSGSETLSPLYISVLDQAVDAASLQWTQWMQSKFRSAWTTKSKMECAALFAKTR